MQPHAYAYSKNLVGDTPYYDSVYLDAVHENVLEGSLVFNTSVLKKGFKSKLFHVLFKHLDLGIVLPMAQPVTNQAC
jgi:hypothetical protein